MADDRLQAIQDARLPSWGRLHHRRLQAILRFGGQKVLDIGCSRGEYVYELRKRGYTAFGLDLLAAEEWTPGLFARSDAASLPCAGLSFDTLTAFEVLEHIPVPERALREFWHVCRKNLILSVPNCEPSPDLQRAGLAYTHWMDRTHCNFFTVESLKNILSQSGFQMVHLERINRIFPDFPALRSLYFPEKIAFPMARLLAHLPLRKRYDMTLLAVADKKDFE